MIETIKNLIKLRIINKNNFYINNDLELFEINNSEVSKLIQKKIVPLVGCSTYPLNEIMLMVGSVVRFNPTHIFEWGTHVGKSARIFYETIKFLNLQTEIISIDLPDNEYHQEHPGLRRGKFVKNKKNVKLYQGDGLKKSLEIYLNLKNCRPLFFLDGDHQYDTVSRELSEIIKNVKNPKILIHDTFFQKNSSYNTGPYMAILNLEKKYKKKFKIIHTMTGLPGMTLVYK